MIIYITKRLNDTKFLVGVGFNYESCTSILVNYVVNSVIF